MERVVKSMLKDLLEKKRALSQQLSHGRQLLRQIECRLREASPVALDEKNTPLTKGEILLAIDRLTEIIIHDDVEHQLVLFPMDGALPYASAMRESFASKGADIPWLTVKIASYNGLYSGDLSMDAISKKVNLIDAVVYVADDVMDTGKTSLVLQQKLLERGARCVRFVPLVDKFKADRGVQAWQAGFRVSAEAFIIGFGLDYFGYCRNFNDIRVATKDLLPTKDEALVISKMSEWQEEWIVLNKALIEARDASVVSIQRAFRQKHGFFSETIVDAVSTQKAYEPTTALGR